MKTWNAEEIFETFSKIVYCIEVENGHGSGVLVHKSGIVATNKHVVETQESVCIRNIDGDSVNGMVVNSCRDVDLAFVQIQDFSESKLPINALPSLYSEEASKKESIKTGETVYAIGHPLGLDFSLTKGIVSASNRILNGQQFIQIDAPINPGNSGGPLYSRYGRLIGLNTCGKDGAEGLNFAIPVELVYSKLTDLITKGETLNDLYYCKLCGNASKTSKFCDHCGYKINKKTSIANDPIGNQAVINTSKEPKQKIECVCCGKINAQSQKFCHHCGTRLNS